MTDAIGKALALLVESITPKWVRVLLLLAVVGLGYGEWILYERANKNDEVNQKVLVDIASMRATNDLILQATRESRDAVVKIAERVDRLADKR